MLVRSYLWKALRNAWWHAPAAGWSVLPKYRTRAVANTFHPVHVFPKNPVQTPVLLYSRYVPCLFCGIPSQSVFRYSDKIDCGSASNDFAAMCTYAEPWLLWWWRHSPGQNTVIIPNTAVFWWRYTDYPKIEYRPSLLYVRHYAGKSICLPESHQC